MTTHKDVIKRFLNKVKFRMSIKKAIKDRLHAKFILLESVFRFRNKNRNLSIKERNKWFYLRWLRSARNKRKEKDKQENEFQSRLLTRKIAR